MYNMYRMLYTLVLGIGVCWVASGYPDMTVVKPARKHAQHTAGQLKNALAGHLEAAGHLLARAVQLCGKNSELMLIRMRELFEQDRTSSWAGASHVELVALEQRMAQEVQHLEDIVRRLREMHEVLQKSR